MASFIFSESFSQMAEKSCSHQGRVAKSAPRTFRTELMVVVEALQDRLAVRVSVAVPRARPALS